jgi:hypothetical protein
MMQIQSPGAYPMSDLIFLAVTGLFFVLAQAYVRGCRHL